MTPVLSWRLHTGFLFLLELIWRFYWSPLKQVWVWTRLNGNANSVWASPSLSILGWVSPGCVRQSFGMTTPPRRKGVPLNQWPPPSNRFLKHIFIDLLLCDSVLLRSSYSAIIHSVFIFILLCFIIFLAGLFKFVILSFLSIFHLYFCSILPLLFQSHLDNFPFPYFYLF